MRFDYPSPSACGRVLSPLPIICEASGAGKRRAVHDPKRTFDLGLAETAIDPHSIQFSA
jgi:hypothetical protein